MTFREVCFFMIGIEALVIAVLWAFWIPAFVKAHLGKDANWCLYVAGFCALMVVKGLVFP